MRRMAVTAQMPHSEIALAAAHPGTAAACRAVSPETHAGFMTA
jgi:hypothetical protein